MKKIYILSTVALALMSCMNAEARKTWDFSAGLSAETMANCTADAAWTSNRTDSLGNVTGFKDATKMSGTLMANSVAIAETEGLIFGTAGLSSSSNYLLDPASIRMARANMQVSLPKLVAGQTVTVVCKSANATSARGISCKTTGMTRTAGVDTAPGNDGYITNEFVVDANVTDSVTPTFVINVGGVDFQLIQIDNGDEPEIEETPKVAYIYESSDPEFVVEEDVIYAYTSLNEQDVVFLNLASFDGAEKCFMDSLETFDMVVITPSVTTSNSYVDSLYDAICRVPMLNFNAALYNAWGVGSVVAPNPSSSSYLVAEDALENELFADCTIADGELVIYEDGGAVVGDKCLSYTVDANSFLANSTVLATVAGNSAIATYSTRNTYMLLPLSDKNFIVEDEPIMGENFIYLVTNAIKSLVDTKAKVLKAIAPSVTCDFNNESTVVTMNTSVAGAKIYYTLDGTAPSKSSNVYAEPLTITTDSTIVNAMVVVPGYDNSSVTSVVVRVMSQLPTPTYSVEGANVTFSTEAGATVYYNIIGSDKTSESQAYNDSVGMTVVRPSIITCFAAADGKLNSEVVEFFVSPNDMAYYNDTLLYENFKSLTKGELIKQYDFYDYSAPIDSTYADNNGDGVMDTTYIYAEANNLQTVDDVLENWTIGSYGQRVYAQGQSVSSIIVEAATAGSYNPATVFDAGATNSDLSFLQTNNKKDPASGFISTKNKYAAPFELSVWVAGQVSNTSKDEEGVVVLTSTDGANWVTVDTLLTDPEILHKKIQRLTTKVSGSEDVYVKLQSCTGAVSNKQKCMLFNVLMAKAVADGISEIEGVTSEVVAVKMFNVAGQQIRVAESGINILMEIHADGTVTSKKIMVK